MKTQQIPAPGSISDRFDHWKKNYLLIYCTAIVAFCALLTLLLSYFQNFETAVYYAAGTAISIFFRVKLAQSQVLERLEFWGFWYILSLIFASFVWLRTSQTIYVAVYFWVPLLGMSIALIFRSSRRAVLSFCFVAVVTLTFADLARFGHQKGTFESDALLQNIYIFTVFFAVASCIWFTWELNSSIDEDRAEVSKLQIAREHELIHASLFRLSTHIAHEINNPLAIVQGYASYYADKLNAPHAFEPSSLREHLVKMLAAQQRITRISELLKQYGAYHKRSLTRRVPIVTLLADLEAQYRGSMGGLEGRCSVQAKDLYRMILCEPQALHLALCSLLDNAFEAVDITASGKIFLTVEIKEHWVRFWVEDNGSGVPKDVEDHIFDPFFSGKANSYRHLGLGLSLCQSIARQHGGSLSYSRSENLGGARFILTIAGDQEVTFA